MVSVDRWHFDVPRDVDLDPWQQHFWDEKLDSLEAQCSVNDFTIGSGQDIYESCILPIIEQAEHEVILVTCFWTESESLRLVSDSLIRLNEKVLARPGSSKIRVSIGLSSRSLFQKLTHTSRHDGYLYKKEEIQSKLGLPSPHELHGLEIEVKSIFFRPFSVMHPKFVIVDGQIACMPSCNVSWENWLEGGLVIEGDIVRRLVLFWDDIWHMTSIDECLSGTVFSAPTRVASKGNGLPATHNISLERFRAVLLPSPHHVSLSNPFKRNGRHPPTPLNECLLHMIRHALKSVYIVTPNLTSQPVIEALLEAIGNGVDVTITTNRLMMVLEQIVTAATVTELCVWKMVRVYRRLAKSRQHSIDKQDPSILENGQTKPLGHLRIGYYRPTTEHKKIDPVKSHIKCTVVDGEVVVLGSGNMDRPSWFTSGELGIALVNPELTQKIQVELEKFLQPRRERYYGFENT